MMIEPDPAKHHIFSTWREAWEAWNALPEDQRAKITPPRQGHKCWIFDRDTG
jgi:hypothetical protein